MLYTSLQDLFVAIFESKLVFSFLWTRSVLNYFKFAPPPFERILMKGSDLDLSAEVYLTLIYFS